MAIRVGPVETIDEPAPARSILTAEEAARLPKFAYGWLDEVPSALLTGVIPGLGVFVLTFGLWCWLAPVDDPFQQIGWFQALGVAIGLWVAGYIVHSHFRCRGYAKFRAASLKRDVAEGVALDLNLDIARAVEIEEFEDEGAGFFLELIDGRVLCLISQDLYEYASDIDLEEDEKDRRSEFPQTRIRYRYAPHSGILLDLAGIGEPLRPFGNVKTTGRFFKKDKQTGERSYTGPEDGMVYEGPLEATLAAFKYKLRPL